MSTMNALAAAPPPINRLATAWWFACMLPVLSGCITAPSVPLAGETQQYATIEVDRHRRLPVLVSWYENCSWRICDSDHLRAQGRLLACINDGIRRGESGIVAVAGGALPPVQPSVLSEDPRERGQPDARITAEVRESVLRTGADLALLIEAVTLSARSRDRERGFGPGDPYALMFGAWGTQTEWTGRTTFNAVLVDVRSGRWIARVRRAREGGGSATSGFIAILLPVLYVQQDPETERLTCEAVGEAVGKLFAARGGFPADPNPGASRDHDQRRDHWRSTGWPPKPARIMARSLRE